MDTLYLSRPVPIPEVDTAVRAVYLWAHPLRSRKTPGNRMRNRDWLQLDYPETDPLYNELENVFLYKQLVVYGERSTLEDYDLYYKGTGEALNEEEFKSIRFTKLPALVKLLKPYKISLPFRDKELREVYRWQHPNLHVVAYDKKRKGYYRYRIALVLYRDSFHPESYRPDQ